jgi:hypothetical protein
MYQGKYQKKTPPSAPSKGAKRKARTSTKVFYSCLIAFVLLFAIAMGFVMHSLTNWLKDFEASQPTAKCEAVFAELFEQPEWQALYTMAGEKDTDVVNAQSFAAYMEEKIGSTKLTCIETSAGLSGDKKFIVRCGTEKVATFTLTNATPDNSIPTWELGTVEVFYSCDRSANILTVPGYTVLVNGRELDESHIIRVDATKAEEYLPEGIHGYQVCELSVNGLLSAPNIEIRDPDGNTVETIYDEEKKLYTHAAVTPPPFTSENPEYQTLLTAAKTYCEYMIGKVGKGQLKKCFDPNTEIYKTIISNTTWMQKFSGYNFGEETITSYYRYSDSLYSAKVSLTLNVTRNDGTIKVYELSNTFFMENKGEDQWLVTNMINADAQEATRFVRLTYVSNGETLSSQLVDAYSTNLTTPTPDVPEGKVFAGWFVERVNEKGKTTLELAFPPSENGTVHLPGDTALEPMVLQARFE